MRTDAAARALDTDALLAAMRAHAFAAALLAEIPNSPVGAFSEHGRGACTALQASEQMTTDRGEGSWRVSDSRREAKVILFRSIDGTRCRETT